MYRDLIVISKRAGGGNGGSSWRRSAGGREEVKRVLPEEGSQAGKRGQWSKKRRVGVGGGGVQILRPVDSSTTLGKGALKEG